MDTEARSGRNELFQELKPYCIQLVELANKEDGSASTSKALIESTNQLLSLLQQKCQRSDGVFDDKLADYVFFPLSLILRRKQKSPDRLTELTIKCLNVLLVYGWGKAISLELAKQLLLLLTFIAGGVPGQDSKPAPEELVIEAYRALAALFNALGHTVKGSAALVETNIVPALGHCVTVILGGITSGPSSEAQLQALQALDAVWRCVKDEQAQSNFLPGTISALTKCLMPNTRSRRSRKTIATALEVLQRVLTTILSDFRTRKLKDDTPPQELSASDNEQKTLTKSWLKATTAQIKLALANVIKLRSHESVDVRKTLNRLCLTLLDECHDTLADSASMLVETCMALAGVDSEESKRNQQTTLKDLATIHTDVGELIKGTLYNWVTSLARIMQSNNEIAKCTALSQLSGAQELLSGLNLGSSVLTDAMATSLRDSVTVLLESTPSKKVLQETTYDLNSQAMTAFASENALVKLFRPILMAEESQKQTRSQLMMMLASCGTQQSQINMASEMLEYMRGASGLSLLSAYWLSFHLLKSATSKTEDLDEFFESSLTQSDGQDVVRQELYSYSLSVLSDTDNTAADWRIQGMALEVVADAAQRLKSDFRTELVDTLYPVAQLLGSSNPNLRGHAIACLNILSASCGYASTSDLIVDNVDYMVNAISLRLNTFDISPQAPQVLVMMIRLTGPSLLLYLDDVVGSIFAALDNFHGYHRLVEVLFNVLKEIVEVGSKSGQLQLTSGSNVDHKKLPRSLPTIEEVVKIIAKRGDQNAGDDVITEEDFPREPWKDAKILLDKFAAPAEDNGSEQDEGGEVQKAPPTKVYSMVQSIARLCQHYLTNQSPILRTRLLSLIGTACNALRNNEDEFLPLVNDIWPVVIKRLYDEEPFVVVAAADAVAEICRSAGDFMSTRIQTEWPDLIKMARQVRMKTLAEKKGAGSRGIFSQVNQMWESIIRLMIAIVEYVRIDDEVFDEMLELLENLVASREDVRDGLSSVNADAVWLVLQMEGQNSSKPAPIFEGYQFVALDINR